jgi:hypothetical protein
MTTTRRFRREYHSGYICRLQDSIPSLIMLPDQAWIAKVSFSVAVFVSRSTKYICKLPSFSFLLPHPLVGNKGMRAAVD